MKKLILPVLIATLWAFTLQAQPGNPNNPVPFGFVELLAVGGAAFGARKLMKNKENSKEPK